MPASSLGRRRPRPVADAPALDGASVAKAWVLELVALAPLDQAAGLPGPRFAEDAPRLCAAVGAALAADHALDDLEPGGTLAPLAAGAGELAAALSPLEAVTALEALRAVAWSAIRDALDRPSPAQVADLADRLSAIIATLTAAVLESSGPTAPPRPGDRGPLAAVLRGPDLEDPEATPEEGDAAEGDWPPSFESALHDAATATDPLERLRELAASMTQVAEREAPPAEPGPPAPAAPLVEDASEFRAARIAPWTVAIDRRIARHRQDGLPFAVLCVEIVDADRLLAAEPDRELIAAFEAAESAICSQLRPADALVRERPGRYWLTTPDTDRAEARTLAHRIGTAVAGVPPVRSVPLQAALGVAACPADASDASGLEGHAEEGLFAARAANVRVADPQ